MTSSDTRDNPYNRQVGPNLIVPGGCRVIEAKGQYVIPGGIDAHTHFETEFMGCKTADDFYSGSRAALAGGTTTIINHIIQPGVSPVDAFKRAKSVASEKICCDFGFHVSITDFKETSTERDIELLTREGVNSFKVFMAYKDYLQLSDDKLIKVFDICKRHGALPMVHAENGDAIDFLSRKLVKVGITGPEGHLQSRPEELEAEATHRAITLADTVGVPLFVVHVMSKAAAEEISRARSMGKSVYGEVTAAAFSLDGSPSLNRCWTHAAAHVMSPPLRTDPDTPVVLTNLLGAGVLQVTGSDHCVFNEKDKRKGEKDFRLIPNGVNGVEERLSLLWEKGVKTGKMSLTDFVAVTSSNAAKIFNIYPRKGRIAVGSDADVVVLGRKPSVISRNRHHSAVDFNVFEGIPTEFNPLVVVQGGRVVLDEEGKMSIIQGAGKFIPRSPNASHCFSRLLMRDLNLGPFKVDRSGSKEKNGTTTGYGQTAIAGDALTPPKRRESGQGLTVITDLDNIRSEASSTGHHSPGSSTGSLTPTGFHKTIMNKQGVRSQQDSNFKLTGQQIDDDKLGRTSVKLHQPPGGKSSGLW